LPTSNPSSPAAFALPPSTRTSADAAGSTLSQSNGKHRAASSLRAARRTAHIAAVIVTWNRKADVDQVLAALSRQGYPRQRLDVIVVDNASTDGTLEYLSQRWRPERIIQNPTDKAHEPRFSAPIAGAEGERNRGGFASLTIVRNSENHGGCGGFNTGFACVEYLLCRTPGEEPDFVWLVDDDIDLPADTLERLADAAAEDDAIGLVGSRTMDLNDREKTIETTIYFHPRDGSMADHPPPGHPMQADHARWIEKVGGTRGTGAYSGVRDVDVVSACCLLARWSAVKQVGFWDWRYFIYCDDADWSLRFGRAGHRVVCNLDAVVYHTPWNMKLTPARIYYAQRNAVWMLQKVMRGGHLKRVTAIWLARILKFGVHAATHRRLAHAEVIRRTANDIAMGVTGRSAPSTPAVEPVLGALRRTGCLKPGARVGVVGMMPESPELLLELKELVRAGLKDGDVEPEWVPILRNDVIGPSSPLTDAIIYGPRRRSRLKKQWWALKRRPRAVVVFDNINDFPLLFGRWNLHIDKKKPAEAYVERDGWGPRAAYVLRWLPTAARCAWYALKVRPYRSSTRYG
jgi:GT2 family glycosyltransferase